MATEANIPESVCLKYGEKEENALISEAFEEKVTELPGIQVKQLETSSLVAETVNTPLEAGKPTSESGIFFQALSVTMVIADEHSNTPESCKAAKQTEPEEETIKIEEKAIESEVCREDAPKKAEPEVGFKDSVEPSKKEVFNTLEKNQGDSNGVTSSQDAASEDINETKTEEHAAIVADLKEQDLNETAGEFVKEEIEDKSVDAQEASEQCETGSKDIEEQKYSENVKKIEQDGETEEIKQDVEKEKREHMLLQAITSDASISTRTSQVETADHEEKEQDVNVLEKDQDEDDVARTQEVTIEGGLQEKNHHNEDNEHEVVKAEGSVEEDADVCVSTRKTLAIESIKSEEPDDEKAIEKEVCEEDGPEKAELEGDLVADSMAPSQKETLSMIDKDQGDSDAVTSSQEAPCVDVEETTTGHHVTTAIDIKEEDLNEKSREFIKEETEDKSLDAQQASKECEKGAKDQNPEESVMKIEKEQETEEIKPNVELEEKKEQDELLPAITTDVCITTQTKPQVEKTEHEEEYTQNDDGLKEKSDSPSIKEVCEETVPEKHEYEKEVKVVETDEGKDDITSAKDVTFEKDLQEKNHHNEDDEGEVVAAEESVEKDTDHSSMPLKENETVRKDEDQEKEQEIYASEKVQSDGDDVTSSENASNEQEQHTEEIKPSVETTEEKDDCISTQIESQEKDTKNKEYAIENDGDRKEESDNSLVNEVCEENDLKKTESEEEVKLADGSNVTTRESVDEATDETKSGDESHETKENTGQQGVLNAITTDVCSSTQTENIEKTTASEENKDVETIENDDGQTEKPESPLVEVACEAKSSKITEPEEVKHSDSSSTTLNENEALSKEENLEKEDDIKTSEVQGGGDDVTSSQNASNEDVKETPIGQHDTTVAYIEEGQGVIAMPKEILNIKAEDRAIDVEELGQPNGHNVEAQPHQNPEDEMKKEERDLSHESVEDTNDASTKEEKSTLEQEPVEEQSDQDEIPKEKVSGLNERKEVEPKEEAIHSTSLETSTEDTSNLEKHNAKTEILPTEDLETVSEEQIPELVPKSEESAQKQTETQVDEEKGTKEISGAEKTEVQGGEHDVTSSLNASNEDIKETMIGQDDTTVTFVEEGQGVTATPKEILIEEAEDKSIVADEMSLELGQPNEQNTEEANSCLSTTTIENPEDDIKKEDKDLSHESVGDTNGDAAKEEKCTSEQEHDEEHSGRGEVSKNEVTNLNGTTEVEPKEEITSSTSLETSTEDASNSQKEKAESENLPIEDLETVSEVKISELVPKSEEPMLKEKCFILETETHLDEEKGTVTEKDQGVSEEKELNNNNEVSEEKEDLKELNNNNEGNEGSFIKREEDVDEDTEEIKSSVDTKENTEHVTAANVYSTTELETHEETVENDEKSGEKAIEYDEYETVSREENLEKKQEDVDETKMDEHATTNEEKDDCISTQNISQEEPAKNGENAIERDGDLKEKADNPIVKEVCEETDLKTIESEEIQLSDSSDVKTKECVDEATEETKSSDGTKENMKQQEVLNGVTSDVCSSTQTEITEKTTASEENNDVETIKNDDSQTEKPESPLVEVVCESARSEIAESEEVAKQSDTFSTTLNENETPSKEEKLEKEDEINTSEVEDGKIEVTSSQNASNEDIIDQHNTTAAYLEEGQDVSALPKEIPVEEAKDKSIDAEEILLELGQPSENPEDDIKKEDRDLSHESVEDTNDNTANEEKCTFEHELVEEHSSRDFNETTEAAEPQEDITPSISLKSSTEDTSNSEKEKAKIENLPIKDLETVSEVQIPELVPKAEEPVLKEECFISEKETHLDEVKGTTMEEISIDEKTQQTTDIKQQAVKEVFEETSSEKVESEERQLFDSSDVKASESVKDDTEETKSSDEIKENMEQQGLLNVITTDVSSSTQTHHAEKSSASEENNDEESIEHDEKPKSPLVEVVCEETRSEIVKSEGVKHSGSLSEIVESEGVKHSGSLSTILNENAAPSKDEKLEKEDEINTSVVQGGGDEVACLQNASNDDTNETTIGQHDTTVAYVEEGQDVSAMPKEILIEKAEDKPIDAKEISLELGQPNEQNAEETHPCVSKTISENQEDEIKKEDRDLSHESVEGTNDDTTKEEKCTIEHEPVEEHSGQDEVSKEKVTDLNETTEVEPKEEIIPSTSLETSTEDTSSSEKEKAKSENLPTEDLKTVSEVETPELVPKSEESVLKEECFISETETHLDEEKGTITEKDSSDEKTEQTSELRQETVKEVCEETSSEKAEFEEGLKLSDASNMMINEKEITSFKDDHHENDQEVKASAESQGEDNITSSQNKVSEEKEDLQEKNHNEGNEGNFAKSGEGVDEATEEIKSSVETKENTEHVNTTNVCRSTQIESNEETVVKNADKAIENADNEIMSREENLEKKLEEVSSSAQTEPKEETIENTKTIDEAIDNDDGQINPENHEKEQEQEVSELQGSGNDVVSSQNTSNEDTKETAIGQHATTSVHFEEGLGVTVITKEITEEEVEDKSFHAQEASEQCENEAKDKIEQPEESVIKPVKEEEADAENKEIESELEAEYQADRTKDRTEMKDEAVLTEKGSKELGQTKEQNVEESEACLTKTTCEKTEDKITKDEDLSHDSIEHMNENITTEEKCLPDVITKEIEISTLEHESVEEQNNSPDEVSKEKFTDLNEPTAAEPQEDITLSSSLGTSAEDTSNSDKANAVSENLPLDDLESVYELQIPEVMPKSEDSRVKEECLVSATETHVDEENRIVTKEISSDENLGTHASTQQPENSYSTTEEKTTQLEETGETNSQYINRDIKENVTQENQLNSTADCSEMEKDVILTEEIKQVPLEIEKEKGISDFKEQIVEEDSYSPEPEEKSAQYQKEIIHEISNSDSVPAENPEATEVTVDGHIRHDDLQVKEDATIESVDLSNIESTAYPSESEKLATQALESDCDVQIPEVVADSEDSKVKEECIVLATTAENSVEEQDTKTKEISSASDKEQENVTPTDSSDLIIEEKTLTKESLGIHGELKPTSEPVIEEDQLTSETKPQPEQSDITSENITNDQTLESKLEHTSAKDLENEKGHAEEYVKPASENETKSIENLNETTKNIKVAVETEKEKEKYGIEGQVSEEDNCPKELDSTLTPDQKELANEIEYSKPVPVEYTEVTEAKAESQIEVENIQAAEDLSCLSKASSIVETPKVETHEDTEQSIKLIGVVKDDSMDEASKDKIVPALEDSKASELQVNSLNEEATLNQLTPDTDVCQIERSSSRPDELPETEDANFKADKLSVKDETITVIKEANEDSETVASELKRLEVTDKEEENLDEPQAVDSPKTAYDPILSSTEKDIEVRSEENRGHGYILKLEEKPTEASEIATEVAETVPECREASAILTDKLPEASPEVLLAKHEEKITEDLEVPSSIEKDGIDVQKHEKDLDHETEVRVADVVSNVECSEIEPRSLDIKEATSEFINQENQREQTKEADESIKDGIPVKDVKTSTREPEVGSVDGEIPSIIDATADKANNKTLEEHEAGEALLKDNKHLQSTYDQSKPLTEGSGMKQEPLEPDASGTLGTAATEDLKVSQRCVADDFIKERQTNSEVPKDEVPACTVDKQSPNEPTKSKILTEKIDSPHEQGEPVAKSLIPEAANLKASTTVSVDQNEKSESAEPAKIVLHEPAKGNSEVAENLIGEKDSALTKDQQVEKEETGVKTDEEDEEEEDNEDDEKMGSGSDAPVMVEASKDMEVKAHKKSHNILSGVGSKVKHSIAKVKKAITGKSSPPKSPSPKAKNQVTD